MSIAKTIEISSDSSTSFDDAVKQGVAHAAKSIHNIKEAWVKEQKVVVDNNQVTTYRVHLSITFVLD